MVVSGSPCTCGEVSASWVATTPDDAIDDPVPTISFDVARFSNPTTNFCLGWGSLVHARVDLDPSAFADESFVLYEVVARNDAAGLAAVTRGQVVDAVLEVDVLLPVDVYGEAMPLDGWCVDVRMLDAAGNATAVTTSCAACNVYDGPPHGEVDEIPFEPAAGGPCDPGGGGSEESTSTSEDGGDEATGAPTTSAGVAEDTTSAPPGDSSEDTHAADDDVADRGCACATDPRGSAWTWLLLLTLATRRRQPTSVRGGR